MLVALFNVSKVTILCQIAHVTQREFKPIRFMNLAMAVLTFIILFVSIFGADVGSLKHTVFALSAFDFINFSVMITHRLAHLLEIKVFKVKKATAQGTTIEPQPTAEGQDFKKESSTQQIPDDTV